MRAALCGRLFILEDEMKLFAFNKSELDILYDHNKYSKNNFWTEAFKYKANLTTRLVENNPEIVEEVSIFLGKNDAIDIYGLLGQGLHTATFRISPLNKGALPRVLQFTSGDWPVAYISGAAGAINVPIAHMKRSYKFDKHGCKSKFVIAICERGLREAEIEQEGLLCNFDRTRMKRRINNAGYLVDDLHCQNLALFPVSKEGDKVLCMPKLIDYGALQHIDRKELTWEHEF